MIRFWCSKPTNPPPDRRCAGNRLLEAQVLEERPQLGQDRFQREALQGGNGHGRLVAVLLRGRDEVRGAGLDRPARGLDPRLEAPFVPLELASIIRARREREEEERGQGEQHGPRVYRPQV